MKKKARLKESEKIKLKDGSSVVFISSTRESSNNYLAVVLNTKNNSKILFSGVWASIKFIKKQKKTIPDFYFTSDTVSYRRYTRELYKWNNVKYVLSTCCNLLANIQKNIMISTKTLLFVILFLIPIYSFASDSCNSIAQLFKSDLVILQKEKTKNNKFCLVLKENSEGIVPSYKIEKIVILNQSNAILQSISVDNNDYISMQPDQLLVVGDFNFDDTYDFYIYSNDGGISPNNTNNFYLFNKKQNSYIKNNFLSNLPQPVVNSEEKYIESSFRDGCCSYKLERYKIINNKFIKFYTKEEDLTNDGKFIETIIGNFVNNKIKYKTTKRKAPKDIN